MMGNAAETLYKKRQSERKDQIEKDRKIYQACLAWTTKQEEERRREKIERREKLWKRKERERVKHDQSLMENYLKVIEKEQKEEEEKRKILDLIMEKRKQAGTREINSRMKRQNEHIKQEAQIMAKNFQNIDRRSAISRQEMKARVTTHAQKLAEDRKKFERRVKTAENERARDIGIEIQRIHHIEQRIVQDRVKWQAKLLVARGIESHGKRVSNKKLWEIGRRMVLSKQEGRKSKESAVKTAVKGETHTAQIQPTKDADSSPLKKTLSTVLEETAPQDTGSPRNNSTKQEQKKKDDQKMKTKGFNTKLFKRFYNPKISPNVKKVNFDGVRKSSDSDSSESTNVSLNRGIIVGTDVARAKKKTWQTTNFQKRYRTKENLSNGRESERKKTNFRSSHTSENALGTLVAKKSVKSEELSETPKTLHDSSAVFDRLYNKQRKDKQEKNLVQTDTVKSQRANAGELTRRKTQQMKSILGLDDSLKSQELQQSKVERIMGIEELSYQKKISENIGKSPRSPSKSIESSTSKPNETRTTDTLNKTTSRMTETSTAKSQSTLSVNTLSGPKTRQPKSQERTVSQNYKTTNQSKQKQSENTSLCESSDFKIEFTTARQRSEVNDTLNYKQKESPPDTENTFTRIKKSNSSNLSVKQIESNNSPNNSNMKLSVGTARKTKFAKSGIVKETESTKRMNESKEANSDTETIFTSKPYLKDDEKMNNKIETSSKVTEVSNGNEITETRPRSIKVPLKSRPNLFLNSSPELYVVDKRISEVQNRIDKLLLSKSGKPMLDSASPRSIPVT